MAGIYGNRNLRAWQRIDGKGNVIPDSVSLRKNKPKDGYWREITGNYCCPGEQGLDSIIIFQNRTANASIATITSADGLISFSGTIADNSTWAAIIPNGIDEVYTLTLSASPTADVDLNGATVQGNGVITMAAIVTFPNGTPNLSTTFNTSAVPDSVYLVTLVDD